MMEELEGTPNIFLQLKSIREGSDSFRADIVSQVENLLRKLEERSSGIIFVAAPAANLPLNSPVQLTVNIHADRHSGSEVLASFYPISPGSFTVSTPMKHNSICPSAVFTTIAESDEAVIEALKKISAF